MHHPKRGQEASHTCGMRFDYEVQKAIGKGKETLASGVLGETELCTTFVLAQGDIHQTLPFRSRKSSISRDVVV